VAVAGGASAIRQYLAAGLLDGVGDPRLEVANVIASPTVTHVKYRVVH
jgi:hypothetical protein